MFWMFAALLFCAGVAAAQNPYGGLRQRQRPASLPTNLWQSVPGSMQPAPPDAYRNLDNQRMVDPRITNARFQAQEMEKTRLALAQREAYYVSLVKERIQNDATLRGMNAGAQQAAATDAAHYLTIREAEGEPAASQWMRQRQAALRKEIDDQQRNVAADVGATIAAIGKDSGPMNTWQQTISGMNAQLDLLEKLVGKF
jgi:hypothetical protein